MNKKTFKGLMIADIVLLIIAVFIWSFCIFMGNETIPLTSLVSICGLVFCCFFAIFYQLAGCKKGLGSIYFKLFINCFAIVELLTFVNHQQQTTLELMMIAIRFASLVLLSQAKDLGEKKSKFIGILLLATSLVDTLNLILDGVIIFAYIGIFLELVLELSTLIMIAAKYKDKQERGTF